MSHLNQISSFTLTLSSTIMINLVMMIHKESFNFLKGPLRNSFNILIHFVTFQDVNQSLDISFLLFAVTKASRKLRCIKIENKLV